jgi:hypothetical protein
MAMAITMRMVARFFPPATEVTQGPLSSVHYTHIKRPPNSRCVFLSGLEDTTKIPAHSRATGLPDLAGDLPNHQRLRQVGQPKEQTPPWCVYFEMQPHNTPKIDVWLLNRN